MKELEDNNEIIWNPKWKHPKAKRYLNQVQDGKKVSTLWLGSEVGYSMTGDKDLKNIVGKKFENPKPVALIKRIIKIATQKDSIVLDFFAGSGTTGQAVMEVNIEDNGKREFILCTNNENNICRDVTYERLRKLINGYYNDKEEYINGHKNNLIYHTVNHK